jgi:hypothetical protein
MVAGQIPIAATATTVTSSGNLSGAVTTSGSLATTLATNAVATTNITNANITYAKIQNVTAARLLGNPTGSAAAPSEISLGTNLTFAGTVLNGLATPVTIANGGTNKTSWTAGSVAFAASATALGENNANLFWDDTNTRLGVGTTVPQVKLSVTGASAAYSGGGNEGIAQFTTGTGAAADEKLQFGVVNGSYSWIQAIKAGTATRDLMLNPGGGNVAIGTLTAALKFNVAALPGAGTNCCRFSTGPAGADTTSTMLQFTDFAASVAVGAITRNGTNTVAYGTSSDLRLKHEIEETGRGLDALMAITVHDYRMGETRQQGLIAQEVAAHYPEAVIEGGEDPAMDPWMIDYGRLTPLLIRAIQQLQREIDQLKRRLAATE